MSDTITTKEYSYKNHDIELIITNNNAGEISTDVWVKGPEDEVKTLFMFDIENMMMDDIIKIVNKSIDEQEV